MLIAGPHPLRRRGDQRGVSMIELMVGTAIGLLIVAGLISLYVSNLTGSRKLLLEARLNQDLRAAADLVARDLRRASFWDDALSGTRVVGSTTATAINPYRSVTYAVDDSIQYGFSRDATENNALDTNEQFGFRVVDGMLQMQTAQGTWQAVTNPGVVNVSTFAIDEHVTPIALGHLCARACAVGTPNCPTTTVRSYDVVLEGRAVADARVVRQLRSTVRLRNDRLEGQCP